jgi:hypothetical protein
LCPINIIVHRDLKKKNLRLYINLSYDNPRRGKIQCKYWTINMYIIIFMFIKDCDSRVFNYMSEFPFRTSWGMVFCHLQPKESGQYSFVLFCFLKRREHFGVCVPGLLRSGEKHTLLISP